MRISTPRSVGHRRERTQCDLNGHGGQKSWLGSKRLSLDAVRKNTAGQLTEDGKNSVKAGAKKR